ncbi:MAG: histidine phosphatase family protein [Caldilineaceae bacterium]|nr:histidine phosphatase family protein [Caldilineaceae bacterium]MBP8110662.1 histidine phosphatase family protein [Caldilineaceae bacterium]MBP8124016.1 histidine phosphatase family protein [Caldilineaceae bacterium]MBP9074045.1 histidine phosphatase family protein [Caldilineaceae bacterium]
MKRISILRHAKAAPYGDYSIDFQRPLAGRGPDDARLMAGFLAGQEQPPDWIISSPALRARQTAEIAAQILGLSQAILWDERVYEATAETLLQVVQAAPERCGHVLLVGHNPGCAELAAGLCAGGSDRIGLHLPTAGLVCLQSDVFYWHQMRRGAAYLRLLVSPKLIKGLLNNSKDPGATKRRKPDPKE